jgi:hypothetical protein
MRTVSRALSKPGSRAAEPATIFVRQSLGNFRCCLNPIPRPDKVSGTPLQKTTMRAAQRVAVATLALFEKRGNFPGRRYRDRIGFQQLPRWH